jgi:hypothetical protein
MAGLWDRLRNVELRTFQTEITTSREARRDDSAADGRIAGREEIASEISQALHKMTSEMARDWARDLAQGVPAEVAAAHYDARIEAHNTIANILNYQAELDHIDGAFAVAPIHVEEMRKAVTLAESEFERLEEERDAEDYGLDKDWEPQYVNGKPTYNTLLKEREGEEFDPEFEAGDYGPDYEEEVGVDQEGMWAASDTASLPLTDERRVNIHPWPGETQEQYEYRCENIAATRDAGNELWAHAVTPMDIEEEKFAAKYLDQPEITPEQLPNAHLFPGLEDELPGEPDIKPGTESNYTVTRFDAKGRAESVTQGKLSIDPLGNATHQDLRTCDRLIQAECHAGNYAGEVFAVADGKALQQVAPGIAVQHPTALLDRTPGVGEWARINYSDCRGTVRPFEPRQMERGLGR